MRSYFALLLSKAFKIVFISAGKYYLLGFYVTSDKPVWKLDNANKVTRHPQQPSYFICWTVPENICVMIYLFVSNLDYYVGFRVQFMFTFSSTCVKWEFHQFTWKYCFQSKTHVVLFLNMSRTGFMSRTKACYCEVGCQDVCRT